MYQLNRRKFVGLLGPLAMSSLIKSGPDTIIHNANIITVNPKQPRAQAIAIFGDRILAIGSNEEILKLRSSFSTTTINMDGHTITPGFIDAHSHPAGSGLRHLTNIDCSLDTIAKIKAEVTKKANTLEKGKWIFGFKYDDTKTKEGRYISRQDLDEAAPHHPVIITHRGGHTAFVNSLALKMSGINKNTPDPNGGHIDKDLNGDISGRLLETATDLIKADAPDITDQMHIDGVTLISQMLAKAGITSIHDASGSIKDLESYQLAKKAGTLHTRIYNHIRGFAIYKMIEAGIKTGLGDKWVKVGPLKAIIDGSISERTARLSKPYIGSDDDYGILVTDPDDLYTLCKDAHDAGWQIGVHSNGDVGIDITLGIYERLQKENPRIDPRFRLEHCTVINDSLVKRIAAIGAIPCPFSTYVYWHSEKMKFYGPERLNHMFALRSFLDAGIKVTQTSDYPPGPYEPMMAIQSSVTRVGYDGQLWGPNQKITVEEAIKVGTIHGAYSSFEEHEKGSLEIGKLADLVVLGEDPTTADPMNIINIPVLKTMVGGRWVYEME